MMLRWRTDDRTEKALGTVYQYIVEPAQHQGRLQYKLTEYNTQSMMPVSELFVPERAEALAMAQAWEDLEAKRSGAL